MNINMPRVKMSELIDILPEGTFYLRVHKAEWVAVPKNKNANPYIKTWLVITGSTEVGRMVFMNYPIAGDGSFRLRELLEVTSHKSDFELESPEQLVGLEFRAVVVVEKGTDGYRDKSVVRTHLPLLE